MSVSPKESQADVDSVEVVREWISDLSFDQLAVTKAEQATKLVRYQYQENIENLAPVRNVSVTLTAETPSYKLKITKKDAEAEAEQFF